LWRTKINKEDFINNVIKIMPVGKVLQNPGGGTSTIAAYSNSNISYQRENSTIAVKTADLYESYNKYRGSKCSSNDLKKYMPKVFDSTKNGHDCNCTFLFMLLKEMHLTDKIEGAGVRGSPFYVDIR
jgi:hypothetical protein